MKTARSLRTEFITALVISSLISIGFYIYGAWRNDSSNYSYLVWNLLLAWLPLLFSVRLFTVLQKKLWSSWEAMGLTVLWLIFLPNSFYMISDFIHLQESARVDLLFDAVMFTSFVYTAVILGFSSLYIVQNELRKRLSQSATRAWVTFTLFVCSVAIFVGRDLRWNSWDIFFNPGGLLFDFSDRLYRAADYPQMLLTIAAFFILLTSMYNLVWRGVRLLRST